MCTKILCKNIFKHLSTLNVPRDKEHSLSGCCLMRVFGGFPVSFCGVGLRQLWTHAACSRRDVCTYLPHHARCCDWHCWLCWAWLVGWLYVHVCRWGRLCVWLWLWLRLPWPRRRWPSQHRRRSRRRWCWKQRRPGVSTAPESLNPSRTLHTGGTKTASCVKRWVRRSGGGRNLTGNTST